jgi:hypothetical protein
MLNAFPVFNTTGRAGPAFKIGGWVIDDEVRQKNHKKGRKCAEDGTRRLKRN